MDKFLKLFSGLSPFLGPLFSGLGITASPYLALIPVLLQFMGIAQETFPSGSGPMKKEWVIGNFKVIIEATEGAGDWGEISEDISNIINGIKSLINISRKGK